MSNLSALPQSSVESSPPRTPPPARQFLRVPAEWSGVRLDRFLKKMIANIKQGDIEKWCRKGLVRVVLPTSPEVSDPLRSAGFRIEAGQQISCPALSARVPDGSRPKEKEALSRPQRRTIRAMVVATHPAFWVLNKPTGWAVQGGTQITHHLDMLLPGLAESPEDEPKIVHRLDKDTSGLLLVARNYPAARFLAEAFREHRIRKTYHAIVVGRPPADEGVIDFPLLKSDGTEGDKVIVDPINGQTAQTFYVLEADLGQNLYRLRLTPTTGRMHQLRVHCATIGCPILGDGKYGGPQSRPLATRTRLMLHASGLTLTDAQQQEHVFSCSLPKAFVLEEQS